MDPRNLVCHIWKLFEIAFCGMTCLGILVIHVHVYLDKTRLIIVIGLENILFRFIPRGISMLSIYLRYDMSYMCNGLIIWQVQVLSSPGLKGRASFCLHLLFVHLFVNFLHFDHHLWKKWNNWCKLWRNKFCDVSYKKKSLFSINLGKNMATHG